MRRWFQLAAALSLLLLLASSLTLCSDSKEKEGSGKITETGLPEARRAEILAEANRGISLMEQYQPVDSAEAFAKVVELAPGWKVGRINYGIALLNTQLDENYGKSEEQLRLALEWDPADPWANYSLGMLLSYLDQREEALDLFRATEKVDPNDPHTLYQIGRILQDGDAASAREYFQRCLTLMPHHQSATYGLAQLLRRTDTERSEALMQRFTELKDAKAGVTSGYAYGEMGTYADVIRVLGEIPSPQDDAKPRVTFTESGEAAGLTSVALGEAGWPGPGEDMARSFGPGAAVADVDGDGDLDLYRVGVGDEGQGALMMQAEGKFSVVDLGIDGRGAIGAFFGDADNDGDPDLLLTRAGSNRFYRNDGVGGFSDQTEPTGLGGGDTISLTALWTDADHDGDLDCYVAEYGVVGASTAGAPNKLWRNNGNGTFEDVAAESGLDGGASASVGVVFLDLDDDLDDDVVVFEATGSNRVYLNERMGLFTDHSERFPSLTDASGTLGALVGDLDRDGHEDIVLIRGQTAPTLLLRRGTRLEASAELATITRPLGGAANGSLGDFDLDGDLDLLLLGIQVDGKTGHRLLTNRGDGSFTAPTTIGTDIAGAPSARGAIAADLECDGTLEVIVAHAGARAELWRTKPTDANHWLQVRAKGVIDKATLRSNDSGLGLRIEVKTGTHLQRTTIRSTSGFLGSIPNQAHFGLGTAGKVDYVRLQWPDAVLQSELEVPANQCWQVTQVSRKPSSCPILFTWNGERFAYVTDFLGVGGLGFFVAPGEYAPPDPTEDVRIPPSLIAPKDGRYLMRIAEPLEEVTYLDQLHLIAYDHPSEWEIHPDERFAAQAPFPTGEPYAVAEKVFPAAARDEQGRDVLERVLTVDRQTVDIPVDPRFVGYAADHWLELDFSDRLRDFAADDRLVLYLWGWVEYTYSHVNYAAGQAGLTMTAPSIEVPDGEGGWRTVVADAGFPAGLPRMMTFDVSELPIRQDGRLRLRTNMEIFWDQAFIARDVQDDRLKKHVMPAAVAQLRHLGYPREFSPDGEHPTEYDYQRLDQGVPYKILSGRYTGYGDVRELLTSADDRFVIMARGEEIAVEFDATTLPDLPEGWTRTLVLHSEGYCKDMDLYTATPDTVEPLPYRAMDNYPPKQPLVMTEAQRADYERWQSRVVLPK